MAANLAIGRSHKRLSSIDLERPGGDGAHVRLANNEQLAVLEIAKWQLPCAILALHCTSADTTCMLEVRHDMSRR